MPAKIDLSFFNEQVGQEFIKAVQQTLHIYTGGHGVLSRPRLFRDDALSFSVGGMVNFLSHGVDGSMVLAFEKNFILQVYEEILGEKQTEITKDVQDCVGELTNNIYGVAKAALVNAGYEFPMALPQTSPDVKSLVSKGVSCIELPFTFSDSKTPSMALILVVKRLDKKIAS